MGNQQQVFNNHIRSSKENNVRFFTNKNIPKEYESEKWFPITYNHIDGIEPGQYFISTWGRIYDLYGNKYYPNENVTNTRYVTIYFRLLNDYLLSVPMHRFMMFYFSPIENWEHLEVNHIDGIKYHNWIWNLEWTTHKENMQHARKIGLTKIGEDCTNSIMTNAQIEIICKLIANGKSPYEINNICKFEYNWDNSIDYSAITDSIKNNYAWKEISSKYDFSNMYHRKFKFSENEIHEIYKLFEKFGRDLSYKSILNKLNIDYSNFDSKELANLNACIYGIRNKKYFKKICDLYDY